MLWLICNVSLGTFIPFRRPVTTYQHGLVHFFNTGVIHRFDFTSLNRLYDETYCMRRKQHLT